jgi:hypothetical protein
MSSKGPVTAVVAFEKTTGAAGTSSERSGLS